MILHSMYEEKSTEEGRWWTRSNVTETGYLIDDGWHLQYMVRENGQYSLQITSNTFWGDRRGLQAAKSDRMVDYGPDASVPGVFATFPKGEDPIVAE